MPFLSLCDFPLLFQQILQCFHIVVVQSLSRVPRFATPWTAAHQTSLSLSPRVGSNSCPLSRWCQSTISSSVVSFSSCLQSFPASGSFQWVGSLHQVAKVLELQHQSFQWIFRVDFKIDWFDLLAVHGTLESSSSATVWKHQFFGAQPSLWSNSHIHAWLLEKP